MHNFKCVIKPCQLKVLNVGKVIFDVSENSVSNERHGNQPYWGLEKSLKLKVKLRVVLTSHSRVRALKR